MNHDDLISKYLDGELSPEQDSELRKQLNDDLAAREDFDAHVLIHAALKDDAASIKPSKKLVSTTEDKILSRILRDKPLVFHTESHRTGNVLGFSSLVAAILILGFVAIGDNFIRFGKTDLMNELNAEKQRISKSDILAQTVLFSEKTEYENELVMNIPSEDNSRISNQQGISSFNNNVILAQSTVTNTELNMTHAVTVSAPKPQTEVIMAANSVNEISTTNESNTIIEPSDDVPFANEELAKNDKVTVSNEDIKIAENSVQLTEVKIPEKILGQANMFKNQPENSNQVINASLNNGLMPDVKTNFYGTPSDVRLVSFVGTEVFQGGFHTDDAKLISNISQSIAYNLDDNSRIGIDVGYSSYSFSETRIGRLPSKTFGDGSGENTYGTGKVLVRDYDGSSWIEFPYTVNMQQQLMWGTGFYERTLVNNKIFKIDARVGLGGTSQGPLGYSRIFGNLKVFNWLSLNAGADARVFIWSRPSISTQPSDLKSSISIIYGFEIKL